MNHKMNHKEGDQDRLEAVFEYHSRTKHHLDRYAASPEYLDWATQPDPFRRFQGAELLLLDHPSASVDPEYDGLHEPGDGLHEPGRVTAQALDGASLSRFFYLSLALSAWKRVPGSEAWPLRVNPSSGNLHPTEAYLIAGPVTDLSREAGIYHYAPREHALEQRLVLEPNEWAGLASQLPESCVLIGLASIYCFAAT
jgi:hypothetical protein